MGGRRRRATGLSCWAAAPAHLGETAEMDWRVSPCWHFSLPALLSFSSMFVGKGDDPSSPLPPRLPLPRYSPSPLPQEAKEGRRGRGAGLPLGTAVAQSISPKPRNFLLPKRKKKKKNPSGHLSSLPHWDSRDWICGVSREGGSGLETLSGKSGGVPCQALRQAHFGLIPSPPPLLLQANHQRWPSPDLRPLGWSLGGWGLGRGCCTALRWEGWQ